MSLLLRVSPLLVLAASGLGCMTPLVWSSEKGWDKETVLEAPVREILVDERERSVTLAVLHDGDTGEVPETDSRYVLGVDRGYWCLEIDKHDLATLRALADSVRKKRERGIPSSLRIEVHHYLEKEEHGDGEDPAGAPRIHCEVREVEEGDDPAPEPKLYVWEGKTPSPYPTRGDLQRFEPLGGADLSCGKVVFLRREWGRIYALPTGVRIGFTPLALALDVSGACLYVISAALSGAGPCLR